MPSFNPEPLEAFLAAHVGESWRRVEVRQAVFPVLQDFVERDYVFRPLVEGDLGRLRADFEAFAGFSVREVRVISIEAACESLRGGSVAEMEMRIEAFVNQINEAHVEIEVLTGLESWVDWCMSGKILLALATAYEDGLPDPEDTDSVRSELLVGVMNGLYVPLQGTAFLAAAVGDDIVFKRLELVLKWLSRCVPLGGVKAEPGVITVLVK